LPLPEDDLSGLFETGTFLFRHVTRVSEGLGNGLSDGSQRPNMRTVHRGPFGGPDAQSCVSCHNLKMHGGGAPDDNIFQGGDGVDPASALQRNAPSVLGLAVREAIALEISTKLAQQIAEVPPGETVELCVGEEGAPPCFGSATSEAPGGPVAVAPEGMDPPLWVDGTDGRPVLMPNIQPFGWKGREETVNRFLVGGFRVHFGIQSEERIDAYCNERPPESLIRAAWIRTTTASRASSAASSSSRSRATSIRSSRPTPRRSRARRSSCSRKWGARAVTRGRSRSRQPRVTRCGRTSSATTWAT
jgi:hypothetical protein